MIFSGNDSALTFIFPEFVALLIICYPLSASAPDTISSNSLVIAA